jgi:hypothetical protein
MSNVTADAEHRFVETEDGLSRLRHSLLAKWFDMLPKPVEDVRKTEFMALHRASDKSIAIQSINFYEKAIPPEQHVCGGESDALIAVNESMVVSKGFHQSGGFFFDGIVIADLRTKNGGLYGTLIADTMEAAKHFDQQIVHPVDFRYREEFPHLLCETLQ